jgi:predicted ATPase/DNA-binding SARP family transcriptional activator
MEYRLLGPLQVVGDDGAAVSVPAPKRRALLAVQLLHANEPVAIGTLIDALWGADPPPAAVSSLRAHVSRLRREIGPVIVSAAGGYRMAIAPGELDAREFEERVAAARRQVRAGQLAPAVEAFRGALALWQGPALADFALEAWAQTEIQRLTELRISALEERIEAELALGRHQDLIPELESIVGTHPLREGAWGQLMRALYRAGRQADALAAYRRLRTTLVEELGIDPSPELQRLEARILQQDPELGTAVGYDSQPVQLPTPLTGLTGRHDELRRAVELVRAHRLVTLTGPGGVGKTRLAIAVAQSLIDEHPDGTLFVDLSGVREPALVLASIGEVTGGGERPAAVIGSRQMLLVLDNFEQVLPASTSVAELLSRCRGLRVLVTSRAPLQVRGEQLLEVPPLSSVSAAELFEERARSAVMADTPAEIVREIVARLDNLPLAIELAAARVRVLSAETLRDELSERLRVLEAPGGHLPERHRTLRETIAWSYDLLGESGRATLRRLSVFPGSFDLKGGCAVAMAELNGIAELVDQSLLRRAGSRYRMLDTIRDFAAAEADACGDRTTARLRHLEHYLAVATSVGRETTAGGPLAENAWQVMCRTERDNLRLAFDTAAAIGNRQHVMSLFNALGMYWLLVGAMDEGERWGELALQAAAGIGPGAEIRSLMVLSEYPRLRGEHERAIALKERAAAMVRAEGMDSGILATILEDAADSYGALGRFDEARARLDEALPARRRSTVDDPLGMAHTWSAFVLLALQQRRPDEALRRVEDLSEAEAAARDVLHPDWVVESNGLRARTLHLAGRLDAAREMFRRNLQESAAIDFRMTMADALDGLGAITAPDDPAAAARLLGMGDRVRAESGLAVSDPTGYEATVASVRAQTGDDGYDREHAAGHALPMAAIPDAALLISA